MECFWSSTIECYPSPPNLFEKNRKTLSKNTTHYIATLFFSLKMQKLEMNKKYNTSGIK